MFDKSKRCREVIRSSAVTIWLKLAPAANLADPPSSSDADAGRLAPISSAAFFNLRAGFLARLHASHSKSGELDQHRDNEQQKRAVKQQILRTDCELLRLNQVKLVVIILRRERRTALPISTRHIFSSADDRRYPPDQ